MFREAHAKAKHYTRPVAGVTRMAGGQCTSGIGSFVVINKEGWILILLGLLSALQKTGRC